MWNGICIRWSIPWCAVRGVVKKNLNRMNTLIGRGIGAMRDCGVRSAEAIQNNSAKIAIRDQCGEWRRIDPPMPRVQFKVKGFGCSRLLAEEASEELGNGLDFAAG
jgi:hypothetical protein